MNIMQFTIGGREHERLTVGVLGYSRPEATNASDGNWLDCRVSIAAGGFRGSVTCSLRAEDSAAFEVGLQKLEEHPRASAEFRTTEEQLSLLFTGDGLGHFEIRGEVVDQPGSGNSLRWRQEVDQTQLADTLKQVQAITACWPVRGA